jgi:hypothetical protein
MLDDLVLFSKAYSLVDVYHSITAFDLVLFVPSIVAFSQEKECLSHLMSFVVQMHAQTSSDESFLFFGSQKEADVFSILAEYFLKASCRKFVANLTTRLESMMGCENVFEFCYFVLLTVKDMDLPQTFLFLLKELEEEDTIFSIGLLYGSFLSNCILWGADETNVEFLSACKNTMVLFSQELAEIYRSKHPTLKKSEMNTVRLVGKAL